MKKRQIKNQPTLPLENPIWTLLPQWDQAAYVYDKPCPILIELACAAPQVCATLSIHWKATEWGVEGHFPLTPSPAQAKQPIGSLVLPALNYPLPGRGQVIIRLLDAEKKELTRVTFDVNSPVE